MASLIKKPLGKADFADARLQLVEVGHVASGFHALVIQGKALDDVFLEDGCRPDAELRGAFGVHAVADGDDGVEVVKIEFARDIPVAFTLNYSKFSSSCEFLQFSALVDFLQMVSDGVAFNVKEKGHCFLRQPNGFSFKPDVDMHRAIIRLEEQEFGFVWVFVLVVGHGGGGFLNRRKRRGLF